jgi:FtsP/CotA-like multicopper oxidase with cupredoxin domain
MRAQVPSLFYLLAIAALSMISSPAITAAVIDDAADLMQQQAQEKDELGDMKRELGNIKSTIKDATQGMQQLKQQVNERANADSQEVHLIVKDNAWEVAPGVTIPAVSYNGQQPGPIIRVQEGNNVKILVHNQSKSPTSMCFHGMVLPQNVAGLPRKDAGMVAPGQTFAFQFIAPAPGTYWYHPQVIHGDQTAKGMYGALIVDPARHANPFDRDYVLVLGDTRAAAAAAGVAGKVYFTVNGKSAPAIPAIEVHNGERMRFRIINASTAACPLYLTGHKFEVVSINGSDPMEPHFTRDTITLQPGDRYDVEFVANNPGVWSLSSLAPSQSSNDGKFPGGIAVVVRYPESLPPR